MGFHEKMTGKKMKPSVEMYMLIATVIFALILTIAMILSGGR